MNFPSIYNGPYLAIVAVVTIAGGTGAEFNLLGILINLTLALPLRAVLCSTHTVLPGCPEVGFIIEPCPFAHL